MTKMKMAVCGWAFALVFGALVISAQTDSSPKTNPSPAASPNPAPTPRLSATLAANLDQQSNVSRERREQAYVKLLEGQRYLWNANRIRSSSATYINGAKLARQSFLKSVELDPKLAEGYTALAEITLSPFGEIEESTMIANLAVKIQPDNYGAHHILAFAYTIKSGLNSTNLNAEALQKAIAEWKEVARLAPRSAEAWAFLSALYEQTNKSNERIEALKNWQTAATPVDTRYYRSIMGAKQSLSPDSASLPLGAALIKADRVSEAVNVLSLALSDDPDNIEIIDLLKQAVESDGGKTSPASLQALQQAVFANPDNVSLIELLANVQSRTGSPDDAAKSLRAAIANLTESDKSSAALLQVMLGDIYAGANRSDQAVAEYEKALRIQGIDKSEITTEEEREFATQVFGKIIQTYKNAGKINEAKATIERARRQLGKDDLFADKQIISLLRETGRKPEALQAVRNLRRQMKNDYSLLRLEATLLTDLGRVDEAVKLIENLLSKSIPSANSTALNNGQKSNNGSMSKIPPSPYYDDFTNYIFISSLYNQAKRGTEAIAAARQAFNAAESEEKRQIADLSLAAAQQTAGNYQSAEITLRSLLKKTPGNPVALNNLGYFLLERNEKLNEALSLIKRALNIDPTNSSYLDSLGWAYFKLGKLDEAELYLTEAVRGNAVSAVVFEHLGDVYQKQGKFDLAKSIWQKAVNISSDSEAAIRLKEKMANRATK
ncbi:MAG: tetratricopeptide repeat protein [Pyrinomonadaceae bacterium]